MKINISHVAKLANVPLSSAEEHSLEEQLKYTLKHIDSLNEIDTNKVKETNEVNNLVNIWREDEVKPSLPQEKALMNGKRTHKGFFVVNAILEGVAT